MIVVGEEGSPIITNSLGALSLTFRMMILGEKSTVVPCDVEGLLASSTKSSS